MLSFYDFQSNTGFKLYENHGILFLFTFSTVSKRFFGVVQEDVSDQLQSNCPSPGDGFRQVYQVDSEASWNFRPFGYCMGMFLTTKLVFYTIPLNHITGYCTFECGLLEDLHGIELVGIWRGHLSHQEHLQYTQQKKKKKQKNMLDQGLRVRVHRRQRKKTMSAAVRTVVRVLPCQRIPVPGL